MKKILSMVLIAASCFALWQCGGDQGSEPLSAGVAKELALLPEEANGLAYINFDQLRGSIFYEKFIDSINARIEADEQVQQVFSKTGFDFRKDIKEVYLAFDATAMEESRGTPLLVGIGSFDAEKIISFIKEKQAESDDMASVEVEEYLGYTIYKPDRHGDAAFSFANNSYFVAGPENDLKAWLAGFQSAKAGSPGAAKLALVQSVRYKKGMWMTMDAEAVIDELFSHMGDMPDLKRMEAARALRKVNFSMDMSGDVKGFGNGQFDTAENAEQFRDVFKGAIAAAKLANSQDRDMVDILNKIDVELDGSSMTVEFTMSRSDVEKLMSKRMGMAVH